jgi:CRP-like cAMP-binding protein
LHQSSNNFLARLPPEQFELLRPHLRLQQLKQGVILLDPDQPFRSVYFPNSGIISLVVRLQAGELIEVAMVGRDSLFGASAALSRETTSVEAVVQLSGSAYVMAVGVLRLAAEKSPALRTTMLRHEQALFAQAIQSAACNAAHSVKARLARWLLRAHDLSGSTTLPLTQEFLGEMIGVQRSSVSAIASTLQRAGVIAYSRGTVKIRDMESLKGAACECYMTMKDRYDRLVSGAFVATEKPVLETVALAQPPASQPIFLIKDD